MKKTKAILMLFVVLLMGMMSTVPTQAQSRAVPKNIHFVGTVNYDYGYGKASQVKCYLNLFFDKGDITGYTNYMPDWDDNPTEMVGTIRSKSNGTFLIDVHVTNNSGADFDGVYNPKTGVFSGEFTARGLDRGYPFKFVKSN